MAEISGPEKVCGVTKNINRKRNGACRRRTENRGRPTLTFDILPGRLLRGGDLNEFEREPNGFLADSNISPLDYRDLTLASEVLLCAAFFP